MSESKRVLTKNCGSMLACLVVLLVVGWTFPAQAHVDEALEGDLTSLYEWGWQHYVNGNCTAALLGLWSYHHMMSYIWKYDEDFNRELREAITHCEGKLRNAEVLIPQLEERLEECRNKLRKRKRPKGMAAGAPAGEDKPKLRRSPPQVKRAE